MYTDGRDGPLCGAGRSGLHTQTNCKNDIKNFSNWYVTTLRHS